MFSVEELFSKRNVKEALRFLETKLNRLGNDGILLSELENYWFLNRASILSLVQEGA